MQRSGISDARVCSWPPPAPIPGTARSSHSGLAGQRSSQCGPLHSPNEKLLSRATFLEPTSTWDSSDSFPTEPTPSMTKPIPTTGWKSENLLQPIRSRTNSMPSVRRPPNDLWQSNPVRKVDALDSSVHPTPPGLPPRRPKLRRSGSTTDLLPHGSVSLSLALGSQPLGASELTKAVPPIGAERSRVISITSFKAYTRNSPAPQSHDHSTSPRYSSPLPPPLHAKWNNETYLSNAKSLEKVQVTAGSASKEDLERLLCNAVRNKHAPKIISPLSPLRTSTPASDLSTDPEYQLRMPSRLNNPSFRYSQCPPRRARTYVPFSLLLDAVAVKTGLIVRLCPSLQDL